MKESDDTGVMNMGKKFNSEMFKLLCDIFPEAIVDQKADAITANILDKYINSDGILSSTFPPTEKEMLADFNDAVPFLFEFGKHSFVEDQVKRIFDRIALYRGMNLFQKRFIFTWRTDEWVGALFRINSIYPELVTDDLMCDIINFIFTDLTVDGYFTGIYDIQKKKSGKMFLYQSMGTAEVLLENMPFIEKYGLVDDLNTWISGNLRKAFSSKYYKRCGLFPYMLKKNLVNLIGYKKAKWNMDTIVHDTSKVILNKIKKIPFSDYEFTHVMKPNTNFVFFLIELWKCKSKIFSAANVDIIIKKWIMSLPEKEGFVLTMTKGKKLNRDSVVTISQNFSVMDICIDYCMFVEHDNEVLTFVRRIADNYLSIEIDGIVPNSNSDMRVHVDAVIDFAVSLIRLSILIKDINYFRRSLLILRAVYDSALLGSDNGYYTYADMRSRTVTDVIYPKFNCLLLKPLFILKKMYKSNGSIMEIFSDREFLDTIKDR